ncbi:Uncharacterised protein [Mycobacteroides abscessus subsp. massiliense]|nr:Uncharacterised protein [Mycobacteroides abscessus subsp. abscessus]SKG49418.1 Uncharacterised protein [Mycobacteroides abscessus subsp. massiliense]SKH00883.1 Uncharacterised protein [Mycobacteroides abscessus subsp. massiliense]SKH98079.1 Uncharacterised protein [Mycobacteroides abscessus subsp. massiliense]SKJ26627.1 Uncharacterised protein [Mycobacteroides abscessus subsp. massiliense]
MTGGYQGPNPYPHRSWWRRLWDRWLMRKARR